MVIKMCLYLKLANNEDCNLLFQWVNDKDVRKNAFNTSNIMFKEHLMWFRNKMNSDNCYIFIFYNVQSPVGQIRIDIRNYKGVIDYSIDSIYRGHGYGTKILFLLENQILIQNIRVNKLVAQVKYSNTISQKSFEKNRYKKTQKKNFIEYVKELNYSNSY